MDGNGLLLVAHATGVFHHRTIFCRHLLCDVPRASDLDGRVLWDVREILWSHEISQSDDDSSPLHRIANIARWLKASCM
jgi:hypothetical protein